MESRKMVPKTLFAGQQWKNRHRKQTYGHGKRGEVGEMYAQSKVETYITICKLVGWGERWEGGSRWRGHMYTCGWFIHVEVWKKTTKFWKAIILQLKSSFQCYSLWISHPCLLPQSPKVCSVRLCLFFCFAYRVIIIIFLNSIYMH